MVASYAACTVHGLLANTCHRYIHGVTLNNASD